MFLHIDDGLIKISCQSLRKFTVFNVLVDKFCRGFPQVIFNHWIGIIEPSVQTKPDDHVKGVFRKGLHPGPKTFFFFSSVFFSYIIDIQYNAINRRVFQHVPELWLQRDLLTIFSDIVILNGWRNGWILYSHVEQFLNSFLVIQCEPLEILTFHIRCRGVSQDPYNRWTYIYILQILIINGDDLGGIFKQPVKSFLSIFHLLYLGFQLLVGTFQLFLGRPHFFCILLELLFIWLQLNGHFLGFLQQFFSLLVHPQVKNGPGNDIPQFFHKINGLFRDLRA